MKYIFYRIFLFNGKNKKVYKKETSIKLYCKLNGKMIDIKKYKELCKKSKTKKVKSTKTKKTSKKVKTKKFKKTKTYRGGDKLKTLEELKNIDLQSINNNTGDDALKSLYNQLRIVRSEIMQNGNVMDNYSLIPLHDKVYKILIGRGYTLSLDGTEWSGGAHPRKRVRRFTHRY